MQVKLSWTEPDRRWIDPETGESALLERHEVTAELGGEFFDKIADAIETRAKQLIIARDPLDPNAFAWVDPRAVRAAISAIALVFRELGKSGASCG